MNEVGPPRPPLSRAAPVLAVGLALVLAGGFAVGIFVGRKPPPDSAPGADQVLPPATSLPATVPVPPPPPAPPSPPPPAVTLPPVPVVPPPVAVKPPPPPVMPADPVPVVMPAHKPPPRDSAALHKPAPPAHAKRAPDAAASRPHKPETAHGLPRPVDGGRWVVQLGAFQSDDHAKLLVDSLAYHGHAARIAGGHGRDGHDWYFVQTPGYATRGDAETVARVLQRSEHLPTYVFETHRPPGG